MSTDSTWHELFSSAGTDKDTVTIQSSDNVKFLIHRKNLETSTGAFPGAEFDTKGEIVQLTETSTVLAILFQFIYPRRHPTLEGIEFALLAQVAEAAEKYEVFAAMSIACVRLGETLPQNALEIFAHAVKHNEPKLIDKAALSVARYSWATMTAKLPFIGIHPWAKYQAAWAAVFNAGISYLSSLKQDMYSCRSRSVPPGVLNFGAHASQVGITDTPPICNTCFFALKAWVLSLEKVTGSSADLSRAITQGDLGRPLGKTVARTPAVTPGPYANSFATGATPDIHGGSCRACPVEGMGCIHLAELQGVLLDAMRKVPRFSTFL